jgi:hypothetical protein
MPFEPQEPWKPKSFTLPIRSKPAEFTTSGMIKLPILPKPAEPLTLDTCNVPIDSNQVTPPRRIQTEPTSPGAATGSLSDSWEKYSAIVSPLSYKKARGSGQIHSVASDHTKVVMPKLNSVPEAMTSMLTTTQQRLERKLEEIAEEDEHMDNAPLSDIGSHIAEAEEEDEVNVKIEMAVSKGRTLLRRSPFIENFSSFAPDDSDSDPVAP